MKDKKEKLEGLLERLTELRKETDLYTTNLINQIKDIVRETNREAEVTRLIPFDVTKAKKGAKVVTRDRQNVRILCFDRNSDSYPIVALVQNTNNRTLSFKHTSRSNHRQSRIVRNNHANIYVYRLDFRIYCLVSSY